MKVFVNRLSLVSLTFTFENGKLMESISLRNMNDKDL